MWDNIDQIRNQVAGYDEPVKVVDLKKQNARDYARKAMRKLYDARRRAGLNAHGKPFSNRKKTNKRFLI